jgi:hypothetical protein
MLCHGPVRVPDDAAPGKATMRCELSSNARFKSIPTNLEVVITGGR